MLRNADWIEIAWTFLAIVGIYYLGRLFRRLWKVYEANKPNGAGLQITELTMGLAGLGLAIASLNFIAGFIGLFRPPTIDPGGAARVVIFSIFMLINVLLPICGRWAVRKHDRIIRDLEMGKP